MAELTIVAAEQDVEELWSMLFDEMHLKALPDPYFGELPASLLSTPREVTAHLRQYPAVAPALGYFLVSDNWTIEPLQYARCDDNPNFAPHWYVRQRYGGPSIHFIPRFGYPRHVDGQLVAGTFADYPFYYSTIGEGKKLQRPPALPETMNSIRRRLLEHGRYVVSASRKRAIAMRNALAAHREGTVLRQGDIVFDAR